MMSDNPLGQPSHCVDCMTGYPLLNYCISLFTIYAVDDNICKNLFKDESSFHRTDSPSFSKMNLHFIERILLPFQR